MTDCAHLIVLEGRCLQCKHSDDDTIVADGIQYDDDLVTIHKGDCREVMAAMPAESVHCVVTSPPYWGLRSYGVESSEWANGWQGCLGLEPTPEQYVQNIVEVFRAVKRVLRKDGTLWLNIGDSYSGSGKGPDGKQELLANKVAGVSAPYTGIPSKNLIGIPWRVAFALQDDGWILRQDIIWSKPSSMPESVTDRPTKSHEYLFLFAKSERYFYDMDASRDPHTSGVNRVSWFGGSPDSDDYTVVPVEDRQRVMSDDHDKSILSASSKRIMPRGYVGHKLGKNKRSVWTVALKGFGGPHFATYPPALVIPCIQLGTSEKGCCSECGNPIRRVTKKQSKVGEERGSVPSTHRANLQGPQQGSIVSSSETVGWTKMCTHDAPTTPCTVLDPFVGSGTTAMVARGLGRRAIGIDISLDYLNMAQGRVMLRK